ncbi:Dam family site-specific DNA-(adenine-N6)-methyltransferase [Edwardsiella piscicida]|nr:Dam family site-specific DNA-(adenine-N6)-methyltransferase [Edwardsiella piscicida]
MKKKRAFLKWAGGKYPLIEEIRRHLPAGERLVEPFVGAGSVFLNTDYDEYLLADINADLVGLYNIVKDETDRFIGDARQMFCPELNVSEEYYRIREAFNLCDDRYQRALYFLYLNRHCYNGLCRYNAKGSSTSPSGAIKTLLPAGGAGVFARKAERAVFVCEHYQQTMLRAQPGAVVYCDPPYAPLSATANFTAYHVNGFGFAEQMRLAELAGELAQRQVPVLISNHETPLTREWYAQADALHVVKVRRTISRKTDGRSKVNELLALYGKR